MKRRHTYDELGFADDFLFCKILDFLNGEDPSSDFTRRIEQEVQDSKLRFDWRSEFMLLAEKYDYYKEAGLAEGREEGRAAIILGAYCNGKTAEEISEFNNIPLNEVLAVIASKATE